MRWQGDEEEDEDEDVATVLRPRFKVLLQSWLNLSATKTKSGLNCVSILENEIPANFAISSGSVDRELYRLYELELVPCLELNLSACAWTTQIPHTSLYKQREREGERGEMGRVRKPWSDAAVGKQTSVCVCRNTLFHCHKHTPRGHLHPPKSLSHPLTTTPSPPLLYLPYGYQAATRNHLSYHQRQRHLHAEKQPKTNVKIIESTSHWPGKGG